MNILQLFNQTLLAAVITFLSFAANASGPISTSTYGNVAIGGYDTVIYHHKDVIASHIAEEGTKEWTVKWRGANWRFTSEKNYLAFKETPEKYRPAYGGHCANALSLGEGLVKTDGSHWEIIDDELHLFYAAHGRERWLNGDKVTYKAEADRAWKEITGFDD